MTAYLRRITRFVRGSYPPVPSVLFAVAWAYGVTGLFAAVDPRVSAWRPDTGTAIAALTLVLDLLLMRALDDLRDLDYDRRFNPDRPLASGAVRPRDLVLLYLLGTVVLVALNLGSASRVAILLTQLGYVALIIAVDQRWRWPSGDNLLANLLISLPAPVLLHVYLYAGYLHTTRLTPDWHGIVAIAIVVLASGHLELAKKITRSPRPGERTYVEVFGLSGTTAIALGAPAIAVLILVVQARTSLGWTLTAVVPLALPALVGWRFWRTKLPRWPPNTAALYLLVTFVAYFAIGLQP